MEAQDFSGHRGAGDGGDNGVNGGRPIRASEILDRFMGASEKTTLTLREVIHILGARAFGMTILFFALANIMISHIPGVSTILGFPIFLLGLQMLLGMPEPYMPKMIGEKKLKRATIAKVLRRSLPYLNAIEKMLRPRLQFMFGALWIRFIGLTCMVAAGVLMIPLIFGNFLPSISMAVIGIGLIERDGLLVFISFLLTAAAMAYAMLFYFEATHLLWNLLH